MDSLEWGDFLDNIISEHSLKDHKDQEAMDRAVQITMLTRDDSFEIACWALTRIVTSYLYDKEKYLDPLFKMIIERLKQDLNKQSNK